MSTANFYDQSATGFPLYVIDDDGGACDWIGPDDIERSAERAAGARPLQFFKITLRGGYYAGAQLYAESDEYGRPDWYNCATCRDRWGLPRWQAIRAYNAEKRRIARRIMPAIARDFGFYQIRTIGRFSDGSAIYERIEGGAA